MQFTCGISFRKMMVQTRSVSSCFQAKNPVVQISARTKKELEEIFSSWSCSPYQNENFDELSKKSFKILNTVLPGDVIRKIEEINTTGIGYLEIRGIPSDPFIGETPYTTGIVESTKSTFVKELFCMGLEEILGLKIFNFRQEGWGRGSLIFNIFPRRDMWSLKGAGGFDDDFRFHSENAWHPVRVDSLFLTGIRPDHDRKAVTYCIDNQKIIRNLSTRDIQILSTHNFRIKPPEIHRKMEVEKGVFFTENHDYIAPVLSMESGQFPELRINFNGMEPLEAGDQEAQQVLNKLEKFAKENASEVFLGNDNMIILNNRRSIHTRSGYTPKFDGYDRWFQRYYLTQESTLWSEQKIKADDFKQILNKEKSEALILALKINGLLNTNGVLTEKFTPHLIPFYIPFALEEKHDEVLKILIRKGPAKPHRIV